MEKGHEGHITSISWCQTDPSMILSGSVDKKVICWSWNEQKIVYTEEFEEPIKSVNWS